MSQRLRQVWRETDRAVREGGYTVQGSRVDLSGALARMRAGTRHYTPGDIAALPAPAARRAATGTATGTEVTGETTLAAALRLGGRGPVTALNFASARNPGGGVANGARAQEESLARAGALFHALVLCPEFYEHHRADRDLLYSDRVVHAPDVPVFRGDDGSWLPAPVCVSFLTAAAPNRRMIERDRPEAADRVAPALLRRAGCVLAVAAHRGAERLVLGAWGCGVFANRPEEVAGAFAHHLATAFAGVFSHVAFAVPEAPGGPTRAAFERAFAGRVPPALPPDRENGARIRGAGDVGRG